MDQLEWFAILSILRELLPLTPTRVVLFTDSQAAIKILIGMSPKGAMSGIWHSVASILSRFQQLDIHWIPGHIKVHGNELQDCLVKRACDLVPNPARWAHINFGLGSYSVIRANRLR